MRRAIMKSGKALGIAALGVCGVILSACGTYVPSIEEVWEKRGGTIKSLEQKIKVKIYCELATAVASINTDDTKILHNSNSKKPVTPIPQDWGVTMVLTMTILENVALNPTDTLSLPLKPVNTFPSGVKVTTPQSFSLGIGGTASSDATRVDKFTFFYTVPDLQAHNPNCDDRDPSDLQGSSFLLESQLGIYDWIDNAYEIRAGVGRPKKSTQEVLSYDVKFNVVTSLNVTPTLKLVRNSISSGGNLFSTKRERTHEMQLTFGPVDPKTLGKGQTPQPGTLATADSLSLQIGSAVGSAIRSLRDQSLN